MSQDVKPDDWAAQTAAHIVDNDNSPFVTDEVMRTWIKTALLDAYARGRTDVFREEVASLADARELVARPPEERPRNRQERRAFAKGKQGKP